MNPHYLIGDVALVAGGLRVGVNDDVGGKASGRAGLSVVVDGVVVKFNEDLILARTARIMRSARVKEVKNTRSLTIIPPVNTTAMPNSMSMTRTTMRLGKGSP